MAVGSLLDDQHWHSLHIERLGHYVNLTLDGEVKRFRCRGTFDQLDLETEVGALDRGMPGCRPVVSSREGMTPSLCLPGILRRGD